MTKKDREEFDRRMKGLDYYLNLMYRTCIEQRIMTKKQVLQELRAGV